MLWRPIISSFFFSWGWKVSKKSMVLVSRKEEFWSWRHMTWTGPRKSFCYLLKPTTLQEFFILWQFLSILLLFEISFEQNNLQLYKYRFSIRPSHFNYLKIHDFPSAWKTLWWWLRWGCFPPLCLMEENVVSLTNSSVD